MARADGRVLLATLGPRLSIMVLPELLRAIGVAAESAGFIEVCIGPGSEITALAPAGPRAFVGDDERSGHG